LGSRQELNNKLVVNGIEESLAACDEALSRAESVYSQIAETPLSLDKKSGQDHLDPLREGLLAFRRRADIA